MQVKTTSGYAEGYWKDGIYHFQGIPYAAAKRFMPPEKYQWEGVYKASRFGRKAIQSCPPSAENDRLTYSEEYGENCLSLDIYVPGEAPEKEEKKKLPVAVYIHGGAFQNGSSRDRSGSEMIRDHRFIYVSVNYRLGVLGYLYLGKALGERYRHTGNNGTLDQLAALGWIRENIEAFGGGYLPDHRFRGNPLERSPSARFC